MREADGKVQGPACAGPCRGKTVGVKGLGKGLASKYRASSAARRLENAGVVINSTTPPFCRLLCFVELYICQQNLGLCPWPTSGLG